MTDSNTPAAVERLRKFKDRLYSAMRSQEQDVAVNGPAHPGLLEPMAGILRSLVTEFEGVLAALSATPAPVSEPSGAGSGEAMRELQRHGQEFEAADDDARRLAWIDFEGRHLTDGHGGFVAGAIYRAANRAFDESWDSGGGRETALAAALATLPPSKPDAVTIPEGIVSEIVELAQRDIARSSTDFLGRMAQSLCQYEGVFDEYPDGDLPDDVREDADSDIAALAGLAMAQLAMLRSPDNPSAALSTSNDQAEVERPYLVWSNEHRAWWGVDECSYTRIIERAGRYGRAKAFAIAGTRNGGWPNEGNPYEIAIPERDAVGQWPARAALAP